MRKFLAMLIVISITITVPYFVLCLIGMSHYGISVFDPMTWTFSAEALMSIWIFVVSIFWAWIAKIAEELEDQETINN